VVLYLCFKFCIFDRPVMEGYVFQVERGPHLLQSCLHVAQDGLVPTTREMHPSFNSLVVIGALWSIDIHHDTSLRSILEDDSISSAFKACIHCCLGKGEGLWLVTQPFINSFCIAHSTSTLVLYFRFDLIQQSTSSFLTCECRHGLNAFNMHLTRCSFGGQWIATHDAIRNVMYAL